MTGERVEGRGRLGGSGTALLGLVAAVFAATQLPAQVLASQDQPGTPAQEAAPDQLDEIVVTRRTGAPPPKLDPVGYLQRYCFDANRLTGHSAPPEDDLAWEPLDDKTRAQFGISDPDVPAFGLIDDARGHTLVIKFETIYLEQHLRENRCTMVVLGGDGHAALPDRISEMFRGRGTQRHVGRRDGSPHVDGWRQWLWTAVPSRASNVWQSINGQSGRRVSNSWVVITDYSFFDTYNYVFADLKTREGDRAKLSMVSFVYKTRVKAGRTERDGKPDQAKAPL